MKRNLKARFELTPLIDVMFLVLVFFIYSISEMAVHRGVKVELPGAYRLRAIPAIQQQEAPRDAEDR